MKIKVEKLDKESKYTFREKYGLYKIIMVIAGIAMLILLGLIGYSIWKMIKLAPSLTIGGEEELEWDFFESGLFYTLIIIFSTIGISIGISIIYKIVNYKK